MQSKRLPSAGRKMMIGVFPWSFRDRYSFFIDAFCRKSFGPLVLCMRRSALIHLLLCVHALAVWRRALDRALLMCSGARGVALQGGSARPRGRAAAACAAAAAARWLRLRARSGRPGLASTAAFEGRGSAAPARVLGPFGSWGRALPKPVCDQCNESRITIIMYFAIQIHQYGFMQK